MTTQLIVVCGEPGVGKSRVAHVVSAYTDARLLSTDSIRKELFGQNPEYTKSESQAVYDEMFTRAMDALLQGRNAVLDATFMFERGRERAETIAERSSSEVDLSIIRVVADNSTVKQRIRERAESGESESDATVEVYQSIRDRFEPIEREHTVIDNSGDWTDTLIALREKDW